MSARANRGRVAAVRALVGVERGGHAEDLLADALPPGPDGKLAWHLTFGVLRNRARIDAALRPFLRQPLASLDAPVRAVLRVGAFEKLYARTPDHAVVQQGVEVARAVGAKRASGLVNAVLRRVVPPRRLGAAEALDLPSWLYARWVQRYGVERTTAWAERLREVPPLCLVTHRPEALRSHLPPDVEPARLRGMELPATWVLPPGCSAPEVLEQGLAWVQDPAAVRVADLLAEAVGEGRVLDATASPGGKTLRLWSSGLDVVAADRLERSGRLRANVERIGASVTIRPIDWLDATWDGEPFDGVLLDAPCTGLGTLRRHPEIRWRRHERDLPRMAERQRELLERVATTVRPGGYLLYAVCSPEPEEGEGVVEPFVADGPFREVERFSTAPPEGDEDAHRAFLMKRAP